jgi:hypothetical protein
MYDIHKTTSMLSLSAAIPCMFKAAFSICHGTHIKNVLSGLIFETPVVASCPALTSNTSVNNHAALLERVLHLIPDKRMCDDATQAREKVSEAAYNVPSSIV